MNQRKNYAAQRRIGKDRKGQTILEPFQVAGDTFCTYLDMVTVLILAVSSGNFDDRHAAQLRVGGFQQITWVLKVIGMVDQT